MGQKQRKYNDEFKARVAVEAIRSRKTIPELCGEFSVHATQISHWKYPAMQCSGCSPAEPHPLNSSFTVLFLDCFFKAFVDLKFYLFLAKKWS